MRAAQSRPLAAGMAKREPAHQMRPRPRRAGAGTSAFTWLGCGAALLAGYLPGILAGRSCTDTALAAYYMDKQNFTAIGNVFGNCFASAFLQATLLLLCGLCCLGVGLQLAFFALRGAYLGFCAASVFAVGGARALLVHWLLTCLPDIGVLLLLAALATRAMPVSNALLHTTFGGGAQPGLYSAAKMLALWYLGTALVAAAVCALGAWGTVFLAGLLL